MIYRVGNGKSINFSRDNWIPSDHGLKITNMKKNSRRRWVNQLMVPASNEWNAPLIREIFHEYDAKAILQIRTPDRDIQDCSA